MKARLVIIGIDDVFRIFQDYIGMTEAFPADVKLDTLLFNKAQMKMCLRVTSDQWDGAQAPEQVNFKLQRVWGVN